MIKDYKDQYYYTGAWSDSSWYKTLCKKCVIDDFGSLIVIIE